MISSTEATETDHRLIRVLIVDDMEQVRRDLRVLLQLSGEVEVVGEASDGREAINQARLLNPDVVIMDLEMPNLDGIEATAQIKQENLAKRIVILSVHTDAQDIQRAVDAGADSFIQKGSPYTTLMESLNPNNPY